MMKWIKRIFFGGIIVAIVGYIGACAYANWIAPESKPNVIPPVDKARYAVQLMSTGQVLLSDKVVESGSKVTLYNYYEYNGKVFLYKKNTLTMDERYFGDIKVVKRQTK